MSGRRLRVEQAMRDVLAEMISRDVKDPRVRAAGLVTIQRVELNNDLSVARVYVSVFGDDATGRKVVAGLASSASFLRGPLGRRLNLQRPPELRFIHDVSPEMVLRLADVVRDDAARAASVGRQPGQAAAEPADSAAAVVDTARADDESDDDESDDDAADADDAADDDAADDDAADDKAGEGT